MTLYLADAFAERDALLQQLGKLKIGKSCIYLKNLAQTDKAVLHALISASLNETARRYPEQA